jgi:ATP-binding cassette subfamily F protein 3
MIQLSNISRQHGSQILFRDASCQILPGTHTGLVGPNGAGKTTVFRIIAGEEEADSGEVILPKKTTIGYFSQDVGEMSGRSALEEVMATCGSTVRLAAEMQVRMTSRFSIVAIISVITIGACLTSMNLRVSLIKHQLTQLLG